MDFAEVHSRCLALGEPYKLNDKITIIIPTVRDIILYGESKYFGIIYAFASTSSDYKAQLDDEGIDWQEVSDYEMFVRLFIGMKSEDLSIIFGELDLNKFKLSIDNLTNEYVFVNEEDGIVFDRTIYEVLSAFICRMHGLEKLNERAGNAATKKAMIEEARDKLVLQSSKPYEAHLQGMVCAMANTPEFKADYFQALEYPISIFMDCVRQVQKMKNYSCMMQGIYAGTIDPKKIPKAQLNWLKGAE